MASIVIKIKEDVDVNASLLLKLKQVLNTAPVEIKKVLKKGAILLEEELFMNDHEEVAQKLMNVVSLLKESKVSFSIHEIGEGHLEENADLDFWEISEETMLNILEDF